MQDHDDAEQVERDRQRAERRRGWFDTSRPGIEVGEPLELLPRLVHVQADEGWPEVGRVPWEVHEAACRVLGKDAERVAARGGLAFGEVSAALEGVGWGRG